MVNKIQIIMKAIFCWIVFATQLSLVHLWCLSKTSSLGSASIDRIQYSTDRSMIASLSSGTVSLWTANNFRPIGSLTVTGTPYDIAFSPDGLLLAVSTATMIRFYSVNAPYAEITSKAITTGLTGGIRIDFSPDSALMVACGSTNTQMEVYHLTDSFAGATVYSPLNNVADCAIDSNQNVATANTPKVSLYPPEGSTAFIWQKTRIGAVAIDISPTEDKVSVAVGNLGDMHLYTDGTETQVINDGTNMQTTAYSETGDAVAFGGNKKVVHIIDPTTYSTLFQLTVSDTVKSSDFSVDGGYLITGLNNGAVYEFNKYCKECPANYFLNVSTITCELCSEFNRGCGNCVNSTYCIECTQGFYLQTILVGSQPTRECFSCNIMLGCGGCNSSAICIFCLPGYYLNSGDNKCYTCDKTMPGCLRCNTSSICEQCDIGYYVSGNSCASCSSMNHCLLCQSSSACIECEMGYYADGTSTCKACSTNCLSCTGSVTCLQCVGGFYVSGGACVTCGTDCLTCDNTGACIQCKLDSYLAAGVCTSCPYPCNECNSTHCINCVMGFYLLANGTCTNCVNPCTTCNETACMSCNVGFYLTAGACQPCYSQQAFCSECTPTVCLNCTVGYYLNVSTCTPCSKDMYDCIACTSVTNCVSCSSGHYLTGASAGNASCRACPNGCETCNSVANCWACLPGYYLSSTSCVACSPPCTECTSATSCLECEETFYLSGTSCLQCILSIPQCLTCDDEATLVCTSCRLGTFVNSGACTPCTYPCLVCNSTACQSCDEGYYLSAGACYACVQNCTTCSAAAVCTSCAISFYLTTTNQCTHCSMDTCMTCNRTHCLSCQPGYAINSTNDCQQCGDTIPFCEFCSDSTHCNVCSFGYTLAADSLSCVVCSSIPGCFDCSSLTSCDVCENGYYRVAPDCVVCPQGCNTCDDAITCTSCRPSFLLSATSTCEICSSFMEGCQLCNDTTTCVNCLNGYYLNSGDTCTLCRSAMKGCQFCDSISVCTHCAMGYYLASSACQLCTTSIQGCEVCSSSSVCVSCQNGYYLDSGDCLLCESMIPGCFLCEGALTCNQCLVGYSLNGGDCSLCVTDIVGCLNCDSNSYCTQCQAGYYLRSSDNLCDPCLNTGCEICQETSPTQCVTCNTMYYLSSGLQCLLCSVDMEGCIECTGPTVCTLCENGYFVNGSGLCQLCHESLEGCGKCTDSATCFQCKSSYYLLSTGVCQTCLLGIEGCAYCTNNTICIACATGYYLNSTTKLCDLCTNIEGCLTCSDPTTCLVCQGNYFMEVTEDTCYPCDVLEGCYSCVDNQTCKVCSGGYLLNDDKLCEIMAVSADEQVKGMKLFTEYIDKETLSHSLLANQMKYKKKNYTVSQWKGSTHIILKYPSFALVNLTISKVDWFSSYELKFYTNNPLGDLDLNSLPARRMLGSMPARRMLSSMPDGYMTYLEMNQETINVILPDLYMSRSLTISYDLSNSEFSQSISRNKIHALYTIFGSLMIVLLMINNIVRAVVTCPNLPVSEYGQIIPHVLALKAAPFVIYPLFAEEIAYAYGFMLPEFPYATDFFSTQIADRSEVIPTQFAVYYYSMGFGCTYTLGFIFAAATFIVMWLYFKNKSKNDRANRTAKVDEGETLSAVPKWGLPNWPLKMVFYNFFMFGLIFNSCASLEGALLNPIDRISVSSTFTVLGILCLLLSFSECLYAIKESPLYIFKLRIWTKAVLLACCFNSPLYIFCAAIIADFLLMVIEYRITSEHKENKKLWLANNCMCNFTLVILVIIHSHYVTLIFASLFVIGVVAIDIYIHYQQYLSETRKNRFLPKKGYMLQEHSKIDDEVNIWNINFEEKEKKFDKDFDYDMQELPVAPDEPTRADWRKPRANRRTKKERKLGKDTLFIENEAQGEESGEQLDSMSNEDGRGGTFVVQEFLKN